MALEHLADQFACAGPAHVEQAEGYIISLVISGEFLLVFMNHGVAKIKRLDLGDLNPIYERETYQATT